MSSDPQKNNQVLLKKAFVNLLKQNDDLQIRNDDLKICNDNLKIHKDDLRKYKDDLNKCYQNMDIQSFRHQSKTDRNYYLQENTNAFVKDLFDEILKKSDLIRVLIDENNSLREKCKQHNIDFNTKELDDLIESLKQSESNKKIIK
jgi:hypothetical protein